MNNDAGRLQLFWKQGNDVRRHVQTVEFPITENSKFSAKLNSARIVQVKVEKQEIGLFQKKSANTVFHGFRAHQIVMSIPLFEQRNSIVSVFYDNYAAHSQALQMREVLLKSTTSIVGALHRRHTGDVALPGTVSRGDPSSRATRLGRGRGVKADTF
jgi:hypothetical protein